MFKHDSISSFTLLFFNSLTFHFYYRRCGKNEGYESECLLRDVGSNPSKPFLIHEVIPVRINEKYTN